MVDKAAVLLLMTAIMIAPAMAQRSAKARAAGGSSEPVTRAELMQEIEQKMQRVNRFLDENRLGGVLITQVRNFSWITAGIGDNHIVITSEAGAVSLLIMRDGRKYVIATNSEIPRMVNENLKGLGYEPREYKWYENRLMEYVREAAKGQPVGTDMPQGDLPVVDLAPLRYELTEPEIKKYRWLGRESTEAVIATVHQIRPGMSEREIEAIISDELMRREIRPTVLLIGSDERLMNFRHAPPSDKKVEKYAMVNICARRWGLVIAVTRFVHFGPIPDTLQKRLRAAAEVNARYAAASRPGATAGNILEQAKQWYADAGFEGEWEKHHQGGAIGYAERDWVATPGSKETVHNHQAFAWNTTVLGAKVEDTILVAGDKTENLTETPGWPTISSTVDGKTYKSPAILVKGAKAGRKAR